MQRYEKKCTFANFPTEKCACSCVLLIFDQSHSFRDKRKWQIAFTTDACSESRENNCFHATITGWRSQLTFGFEKGRQSGRLSRPRTPENTLSKTQSRQGFLPALILDWLDKCRLFHLYALDSVSLVGVEDEDLTVCVLYISYCIKWNNVYSILLQQREILHRTANSMREIFLLHEQPETLHLAACAGLHFHRQHFHVT